MGSQLFCVEIVPAEGTREFDARATRQKWNGNRPSVRTLGGGCRLSIRGGGSFWLVGSTWNKQRSLGRFRALRGVLRRGHVALPPFIDRALCMGSYRCGDRLWDIAHRRLQNTRRLRPLWSSPSGICHGYGHGHRHQSATRRFSLLCGRCSILAGVLGTGQNHVGRPSETIARLSGDSITNSPNFHIVKAPRNTNSRSRAMPEMKALQFPHKLNTQISSHGGDR
jgi:hypothetical protein